MRAMNPYRGSENDELLCPRCKKRLPPQDVATCACGGVWVTVFAATEVLDPSTLRPDTLTAWWRVREPCPQCGEKMVLFGDDPGFFQGCDLHGYFIDADTVEHTWLARGIDYAKLERKRADEPRMEAEREARYREETKRAAERAAREQRNYEIAQMPPPPHDYEVIRPAPPPRSVEELRRGDFEGMLENRLGITCARTLLEIIRQLDARIMELERRK